MTAARLGIRTVAGTFTLHKTPGPAMAPQALGRVDAVLLSHDQHADNPDHAGRALLPRAGVVLTTPAGAAVVPVHYEGWEHLPEPRAAIESAFAAAGLASRLTWLPPGRAVEILDAGADANVGRVGPTPEPSPIRAAGARRLRTTQARVKRGRPWPGTRDRPGSHEAWRPARGR
jgi:hypothetical protein